MKKIDIRGMMMKKIMTTFLGITLILASLNASDLFTCKAIGAVELINEKYIKAKNEVWITIVPSEKRNYIYYGNGKSTTSQIRYMSFEEEDFKYYGMQGGYIGFNETKLTAVAMGKDIIILYENCIKSDSLEKFRKDASEFLNAVEDARNLNNAMKLH